MLWVGHHTQLEESLKEPKVKDRVKVSQGKNSERCPEVQSWLDFYSRKTERSRNGLERRTQSQKVTVQS